MMIMFVTTVLPVERRTGSEIASSSFIDAMRASGHRVAVIGYQRPGSKVPPDGDVISAGGRQIETRGGGLRPALWLAAAIARRLPYSVAKYRSRRYRAMLGERLAAKSPDLLVIDHAQMGWTLPLDGFHAPVALLAHNVEHELYGQAGSRGRGPVAWLNRREARLMKAFESRLANGVDRVWTLTDSDAAALGRLGAGPIRAFPMPPTIDVPDGDPEPERDVGVLGTWTWDANAIGLRWFIDEVRPLLPPSVSVAIAGTGSERFATEPNIACLGRVEDAASFLRSSRVVAVPSVAGGGLQIKTLDAIAGGTPVVATPTAMRGIDDPPPTVRVAEDPQAFAAGIDEGLRSPPGSGDRASARDWVRQRRDLFRSRLDEELAAAMGK
jgi:glycosyltransferase involved in cell wall biosynthesis